MRPENHFVKNHAWCEGMKEELEHIKTVQDFWNFALLYKLRPVSEVLVKYIDRLTNRKIKDNGKRDGRWIWENIKAGMGRRVSLERPIDKKFIYALQYLIGTFNGIEKVRYVELRRTGFRRSEFYFLHNPLTRYKVAIDICSLLNEVLQERLPD